MPRSYAKKLAVISNTSLPGTDSRENTVKEEPSVSWDLETVKCITWNVKLNQGHEEVPALLDSSSKANLIS